MEKHVGNWEKTLWVVVRKISLKLLQKNGWIQVIVPGRDQAKEVRSQKETGKGSRIRLDSKEEKEAYK